MSDDQAEDAAKEKPLPKYDWIIIPAIAALTLVLIACSAEAISRLLFTESTTTTLKCLVVNDVTTGVHAIPNTSCSQKIFESSLVTYKINSCGHRAGMECGPKSAGTYRIVMLGSSFNYGMWVPQEQSFAALLPRELSRRTGRRVELYNEAMQWGFPRSVTLRLNEVTRAEPDMILWPLTPMDIGSVDQTLPSPAPQSEIGGSSGATLNRDLQRFATIDSSKSPRKLIRAAWNLISAQLNGERSVFMLQHFLFKSQSQYVRQSLMQNGSDDFLRTPPGGVWQKDVNKFEKYFSIVKAQADDIGAIVVVAMMPDRAQAAMISMNEWPEGFDPYWMDHEIRSIITKHGGLYVDIFPDFRNLPNPEQLYLPVDGHPDADWHALVSGMMAKAFTNGSIPALRASGTDPDHDDNAAK